MTEFISFIYNFTWTNGEGVGRGRPTPETKHMLEVATV